MPGDSTAHLRWQARADPLPFHLSHRRSRRRPWLRCRGTGQLAGPPGPEVDQRAAHAVARCRGGRGAASPVGAAGVRSSPAGSPTSSADCSPGPTWRPASCRGPSHHAVTADEARCAGRDPVRLGRPVGHHDAPRRPVHDGELRARERRGILPPVRSPSARYTARPSGQPVRNAETNGPQMTRARTSPKQEPGSEPHFLWRARRDSNPQPSDP